MLLPDRSFDAIVIGGGHNGLVAASYLARAGQRVILLEASETPGGALMTGEISPDYRISTAAHLVEAMPRRIEKDLKLQKHGLRFAARRLPTIALSRDKRHLAMSVHRRDLVALRQWNAREAEAFVAFSARMKSCAALLRPMLGAAPPVPGDDASDAASAFRRMVWRARRPGAGSFEGLLRLLPESIGDLVEETFEMPLLKAALAFEAVRGTAEGPFSPGTSFHFLYREAMRHETMGMSLPEGGLGGLADALVRAAESLGVVLRTATPVKRIAVENGVATGVETEEGEILLAPLVLSSADARHTLLGLVGPGHLDARLAARLGHMGRRGATAKLNLALDGLPSIPGLAPAEYGARLLAVPPLPELDQAFACFKRGEMPFEPPMEVTIPSVRDMTLAPPGHHVMSILIQYVPYEAKGGWAGQRDRLLDRVLATLSAYAPDLRDRIVAGEMLLPPDMEAKFGLPGGDWHHGELRPDQLAMFRPAPALARYRTPLKGLYLCGAGSHPGGGISGMPGRLAAELALSEGRRA